MTLSPSSGDTTSTNNLTLTLVQSELDKLKNGTYIGNITVSSTDANVSDAAIPVSVTITIPEVSFVSPYQAVSNTSKEVVIRGSGFSSLTNPAVSFGGSAALSITIISDTEIRATHDTLAAGNYNVEVTDGASALPSFASLTVTDAVTYSALWKTSQAISSIIDGLFFDMDKQALFIRRSGSLMRYKFDGANWKLVVTSDFSLNYTAIALSPNGKSFYSFNESEHVFLNLMLAPWLKQPSAIQATLMARL